MHEDVEREMRDANERGESVLAVWRDAGLGNSQRPMVEVMHVRPIGRPHPNTGARARLP
jgi:hypothetical protein